MFIRMLVPARNGAILAGVGRRYPSARRLAHQLQYSSETLPHTSSRRQGRGVVVSLFAWILLGLLAGFIASHLVNHRGEGMVLDILLGIVGSMVGGWLAHLFGLAAIGRLNLYSIIVATVGAVVFLVVYHAIRRNVIGRRIL